jgi:hypothetical protein
MRAASAWAVRGFLGLVVVLMSGTIAVAEEPEEKRYPFEMVDRPWKEVFGYLTDITGKPLISVNRPDGTFTYKGPPGKTYTVGEIVAIINDSLANKERKPRLRLVRRERSFTLILPDERANPGGLVPQVREEELPERDDDEWVRVVVRFRVLNVEDVVGDLDCKLGRDGRADVFPRSNMLILEGLACDVRRVCKRLQDLEAREIGEAKRLETGEPVLKTYTVQTGNADVIARKLQEAYKDSTQVRIAAVNGNTILVYAPPADQVEIAARIARPVPPGN